ncbi:hypothetical protein V6N12_015547 [Hibiscus sabdariffa]|uniref:LRAT domain-containing protein n=1 Tax=Hibiscus sabdariffa TaxID=183260 RepID=A0ABR2DNH3_9ROSI
MAELRPSDHIYSGRGSYCHHGIFVGEAKIANPNKQGKTRKLRHAVIHFRGIQRNAGADADADGKAGGCRKCFHKAGDLGVVLTCMDCFRRGDTLYRYEYNVSWITFNTTRNGSCSTWSCAEPDTVIKRAYDFFHNQNFGQYNFYFNNCEHFATTCKTGKPRCNQAALGTGVAGVMVYKVARRVTKGPTYLTSIDWTNAHHRRSVAASLVKGVYMLEGDRQDRRQGPECLAPPWWEFFQFKYVGPLIESDQCIFGAIFEYRPLDYSYHSNIHESPRYVIAFRGTLLKLGSLARDIQLDIDIIRNGLDRTARSAIAIRTVRDTVAMAGISKVWLTGHSQGASIAMLAGKMMAKSGIFLQSFLFNPPHVSAPIERIGDETLKHGIRLAGTIIKAGLAFANAKNDRNKDPKSGNENRDSFAAISGWIPCLFVNPGDPICSEYIGYFEHRRKVESFGFAAKALARKTSQTSLGNLVLNAVGAQGVESSEPLHLLPSANLTVNLSPSQDFKQAHGLCQWWRPDLNLKCHVYKEDPGLTLITNDAGESPLFLAVDKRHVRIAQNILEVATDFSIKGRNNMNVLHAAVIRSKHEVFTLVDYFWELMSAQNIMTDSSLKYGLKAIPLQVCATLKIWAARASNNYDYKNLVAQLMMTGKNRSALSETDKRGWTPLHYAAHFGAVDIFDLFSKYMSNENGSAAHIRDGNGRSVLHIAASEGEVNILKRLSDKVPEIWDLQDDQGQTALHLAVASKRLDSVRFILRNYLSHNGLINQQDTEGNTALHLAVIQGNRDNIFEFLIKDNRVDTTVANSAGHTVMDILLLQDHGYDYKKWITLAAASNGGLESLELAINKNGRKTEQAQQPEKKFEAAIDAQVIGGQGLKNLNYDQLKEIGNTNALVATLVATVSFAASFTMPGGYKSDGPDEGMPILSGKSAFRVSVMANVVAFALSTLSMAFHYYSSLMEKLDSLAFYTNLSTTLLINAIIAMVISFSSGTYASLSRTSGLANAVLAIVTPAEDNILHVAAKYEANQIEEEIVKLLCSVQLVNQKNSKGNTPLHVAAKMGSSKTCQVLVNYVNNMSGEIEAGEKLTRMVNSNKDTELHVAVRNGYHQIAELLIREDPELTLVTNDVGESPLFIVVDKQHVQIAQHILEVAADFSIEGRNNMNVIRSKHEVIKFVDYLWEIVTSRRVLTESSFKYGLKAVFVLFCAIRKIWAACNNLDYKNLVARLMLTQKCRSAVSETDESGWTPLHYAVHTLVPLIFWSCCPSWMSAFRLSVMANVIAFALSTLSMGFHFYSSYMEKLNRLVLYTNLSTILLMNAIIAMVICFISGTYAALSHTSGLANAVVAIAFCTVFCICICCVQVLSQIVAG